MEGQLINIAYQYFPKGIDSRLNPTDYNSSFEFQRLCQKFESELQKQQNGDFDEFYDDLQALDTSMHLHKYGLYAPNERAHNLQFADLKGNVLYSICLNISIIAPYYCVYILETNVERFLKKPVDFFSAEPINTFRNKEKEKEYMPLLNKIRKLTEKTFEITEFPEELVTEVIPDISLKRNSFGKFTMFNAFFLDKYTARI